MLPSILMNKLNWTYNLFITVQHNTEVNYPDYRMSLLNFCFRHVSAVKRPSSGLYRASHVKYDGFGTQWDPIEYQIHCTLHD
jgi:hypothetical protein